MNRALGLIASIVVASVGCDEPSPVPPPPARPASLQIGGNLQLGAVGDSSQLTATATYTDGTTQDVTASSEWSTNASEIATITASGVLTARGFGLVTVTVFLYPARNSQQAVVTPPGTFILAGRVREPGAGSLGGVVVRHVASGESVVTGGNGRFNLIGVTHPPRLSLTKTDFEPVELDAFPNVFLEPPLQRVIRLAPESTIPQTLAPNDMEYVVGAGGASCQPCRLIRVSSPTAGTLRVRVIWDDADGALNIWTNGQAVLGNSTTREVTAEVPVVTKETIIHVGRFPGATRLFSHTSLTIPTGTVAAGF